MPSNPALDIDLPLEELKKLPRQRQTAAVGLALRIARGAVPPEKTVERMKKVLALAPDAYTAHLRLAQAYYNLKQPDPAYAEIEQMFKRSGIPLGLYTECVEVLVDLGKFEEAEQKAKPLTEWKPPYAEGMYLYAQILRLEGKRKEAEAVYRRMIGLKTESGAPEFKNPAGAKLYLGEILLERKQYDEAEKWLLEAADTFRDSPRPFENLTNLYIAKGDRQNAARFLAKFKEKGGDPKVYNELQKKIG